jgi:PTH1 family peptidyl-tRNA hydrolase
MAWLVVGLGNPGPKYAETRHNIGFMVIDELARHAGVSFKDKFKGHVVRASLGGVDVILLKPMTFMNVSGVSVGACATFYKIPPERTLVVHDELDLSFGTLRLKVGGGHAGHNGLRSIFAHFGKTFARLRCGIGRPGHSGAVTGHVLGRFDASEQAELTDVIDAATKAVESVLTEGATLAMNKLHSS